jgi:hypothetical protein
MVTELLRRARLDVPIVAELCLRVRLDVPMLTELFGRVSVAARLDEACAW